MLLLYLHRVEWPLPLRLPVYPCFQLNFEIALKEKPSLFSRSSDDIKTYLSKFLNYLFDKLPSEASDFIKGENITSPELKSLAGELKTLYGNRNTKLADDAFEQRVIDLITYSVESIKEIKYEGFHKIQISNKLETGEILPIALIKTDYYESVQSKVFKPEQEEKPDVIEFDENPTEYNIQVYSMNNETGNGGAYFISDNITKVSIHLKGKTDYHGTVFTKSLDEKKPIKIMAIGKKVNNVLKELTVEL